MNEEWIKWCTKGRMRKALRFEWKKNEKINEIGMKRWIKGEWKDKWNRNERITERLYERKNKKKNEKGLGNERN